MNVLWCSHRPEILARHYSDQGLLECVLDRSLWRPPGAFTFEHHEVRDDFPDVDGAVVIINARSHTEHVEWFVKNLARLDWSVVLLCGDEEWVFPWAEIEQSETRRVWAMQPRPEHAHLGLLPGGWYPKTRDYLRDVGHEERPLDWFFAGQVTHQRRQLCAKMLRLMGGGCLVETAGYLQEGVPRAEYFRLMAQAKLVPSPSGPYSVDCARAFEALEAGCVPLVDTMTPHGPDFDYWALLFGDDHGLPMMHDWSLLPIVVERQLAEWPANANRCSAMWQQYKRRLAHKLDGDIRAVSGMPRELPTPDDRITVIIPTSPVPGHPSIEDITTTIDSVRGQLPYAEIIVVCDGVRPEQADRADAYAEYVRRLTWACNFSWANVVPVVLEAWGHQANAIRAGLELVTTPLVMVVEHDTPLVGEIPWEPICDLVLSGRLNVLRLHHETHIHDEHRTVMLDRDPVDMGVPVLRTSAWWNRPHVASTRFYREKLMGYFPLSSRTMVEDRVYPIMATEIHDLGESAWWDWRVGIYCPPGDVRRSGHLDSRKEQPKWGMRYK